MDKLTPQMRAWRGTFGDEYTRRNSHTLEQLDALYTKEFGTTRTNLNEEFLQPIPKTARILEVGANAGAQLKLLHQMGFENLYGIDIREDSTSVTPGVTILESSVFDIPFKDECFDLVFTSGLLIHIHPRDITNAIREIYRCTKEYIWGLEAYAEDWEHVTYRGQRNLMWKTDYAELYLEEFPDLEVVREKRLKHNGNADVDTMFLLKVIG